MTEAADLPYESGLWAEFCCVEENGHTFNPLEYLLASRRGTQPDYGGTWEEYYARWPDMQAYQLLKFMSMPEPPEDITLDTIGTAVERIASTLPVEYADHQDMNGSQSDILKKLFWVWVKKGEAEKAQKILHDHFFIFHEESIFDMQQALENPEPREQKGSEN